MIETPIMAEANPIMEIEYEKEKMKQVIVTDSFKKGFNALYVSSPIKKPFLMPILLGCEPSKQGHFKVRPFQKATIMGVFACGENNSMKPSVANAGYKGNLTGAVVNESLVEVLITNIESDTENKHVVRNLKDFFPDLKINYDIEYEKIHLFPCQHNILRVEGLQINILSIIKLINNMGFECQLLEDKIC
ncbi:hypothetical protein QNI16_38250 [Cytophagaceae bacterium YF14B1]|uniref:Uncharacterized protein n=1 Tax=Xanthocytophaga flava TaxID=3048013 RepID=A0AAE3R115_9BACT|nr:hypothetical protein [Xanthocytophaga flavus]MDJ1486384.1 hypothetical protein [Xanthocytophaga flavus]